MRILIVASYNKKRFSPFILEQANALEKKGCEIDYFGLQGKGILGYLKNLPALRRKINEFNPDVIHAHFGLSGLFANLQRKVPVVTTYHGSDINEPKLLPFSKMSMRMSAWNIFVSQQNMDVVMPKKKYTLLPCGIDLLDMPHISKIEARQRLHLNAEKQYVLFAGAYNREVKNASLAKKIILDMEDESIELLEFNGYSREEASVLMCAVDALLMTSLNEGSPQVIKEALACGCPIVSVDVGDVKERVEGVDGCYVSKTFDPKELTELLRKALAFKERTKGRDKIIADGLDNANVAERLMDIYKNVI